MDKESAKIIRTVWKHSGVKGYVWMPTIREISKPKQRFNNGAPMQVSDRIPAIDKEVDSYWTPAVRRHTKSPDGKPRDVTGYGPQRVAWVDCDDNYDDELLTKLRPSFVWETSPGHKQAVWLLSEPLDPAEFHKDGYMGMLTEALGGDASGVDLPQLLRVPGSWHHKRQEHQGAILRSVGNQYTRGQLLTRVARGLGLPAGLASEIGADDPYGDRSKKLWQFARSAAEAGLSESLTFKLIKACKWNKWKDQPDRLREDISRAFASSAPTPDSTPKPVQAEESEDDGEEVSAWDMDRVEAFGSVIHKPLSWIVPNIIPEGGCGLLVSSPKVGKTRVAIELALGISTGTAPLGINVQRQRGVGFFSLEDGEYLFSSRMDSSLNNDGGRESFHWDGHITEDLVWHPQNPMPMFTNFSQVDFSTDEDKQRLLETIIKYDLKLVIIDTLSMAIGKADVSSSTDMYGILKDIKTIAKATKCAIMFIHHTRKRVFEKGESIQEKVLGSTALHAWVDFILSLAPPEEDDDMLRLAIQTKMGGGMEYVGQDLKIVKRPKPDDDE